MVKLALILGSAFCLGSCVRMVPVDVVTDGQDLFFVLEKPAKIEFVRVREADQAPGSGVKASWLLGYDASVPVKARKYLELGQIVYGRKYDGFSWVEGPSPLRKNVEYLVEITMPGKSAAEAFVITDDNAVIMPHPAFERQKKRAYSISADKKGNKIFTAK